MKKVVINREIKPLEIFNGINKASTLAELDYFQEHIRYFRDMERQGNPIMPYRGETLKDLNGKCYEKQFQLKDSEGVLDIAKLRFAEKLEECKQAIAQYDNPTVDEIKAELKKFRDNLKKKKIFVPKTTWEAYHEFTAELDEQFTNEYAS